MNDVFQIRFGVWWAVYNGQLAHADFNSRGAAQAWLAGCITAGKWRA